MYLANENCLIMDDDFINTLRLNNISKELVNLLRSQGFNPLRQQVYLSQARLVLIKFMLTFRCLPQVVGIFFVSHLSWHYLIDHVCDKASENINMMIKIYRFEETKMFT